MRPSRRCNRELLETKRVKTYRKSRPKRYACFLSSVERLEQPLCGSRGAQKTHKRVSTANAVQNFRQTPLTFHKKTQTCSPSASSRQAAHCQTRTRVFYTWFYTIKRCCFSRGAGSKLTEVTKLRCFFASCCSVAVVGETGGADTLRRKLNARLVAAQLANHALAQQRG